MYNYAYTMKIKSLQRTRLKQVVLLYLSCGFFLLIVVKKLITKNEKNKNYIIYLQAVEFINFNYVKFPIKYHCLSDIFRVLYV